MVSEVSVERFVIRDRTGPLCPQECSVWTPQEIRKKLIGKVSARVVDVVFLC